MSRMFLPVPKEFNFSLNYQFLERSPRELLHRAENGTVNKLLKAGEEKVLFSIREGDKKLMVNFLNGNPSLSGRNFIRNYITEWFDLETDIKPFYRLASGDKLLSPLIQKYYGYRIIGQPDLFESIVWAVLGQQINLQFAYTLKQRFVEQFGERLLFHDQSWYLFPEAKLVSELKDDMLLPLQFSRQKSRYTIGIAEAFASGEMSKERLRGLPLQAAKE